MKVLVSFAVVSFFAMVSVGQAEGIVGKYENLVLEELDHEKIKNVSVAAKVFQEDAYFKVCGVISLEANQQNSFKNALAKVEWHDSLSVCSRDEAEFIVILETERGGVYGLHASNGIESDCFHLVQISAMGELHIANTFWCQSVKRIDGKFKAFNRVLRISKWRSTESGRKILALVDLAQRGQAAKSE